jgi:endonuclease-3
MALRQATPNSTRQKDRVKKIIAALERTHPDARLALDFRSPLELLIGLILAAQARDDLVNQVTARLFERYKTAADYAGARIEDLQQEVSRINFYRNKSRSIHNCCSEIVARFGGKVPDRLEDLLTLPGVGRKTANILLGNAFGRPAIGVDTHVMRVSQRLELTRQTDPDKIEAELTPLVPDSKQVRFCHLVQYHGRRICLAKKPLCSECSIHRWCPYPKKNPALLKEKSPRKVRAVS